MIVHDVEQRTPAWHELRSGIPTSTNFGKIMTESRMTVSGSMEAFVCDLLTHRFLGISGEEGFRDPEVVVYDRLGTPYMQRGSELEPQAALWYEMAEDVDTEVVGFITNDEGTAGCSPDRIIPALRKGVEIKVRSPEQHMRAVLGVEPPKTKTQVQGSLWVTGYDSWDLVSFHPNLPKRIDTYHPEPVWQSKFTEAFGEFTETMERLQERLDAIEGDVVRDDNLLALLAASVAASKSSEGPDRPMTNEEAEEALAELRRGLEVGVVDAKDWQAVVEDVSAGRWTDVRNMVANARRAMDIKVQS